MSDPDQFLKEMLAKKRKETPPEEIRDHNGETPDERAARFHSGFDFANRFRFVLLILIPFLWLSGLELWYKALVTAVYIIAIMMLPRFIKWALEHADTYNRR